MKDDRSRVAVEAAVPPDTSEPSTPPVGSLAEAREKLTPLYRQLKDLLAGLTEVSDQASGVRSQGGYALQVLSACMPESER